ncbi:hypothetical protein GO684_03990 [Wolbachia endosymbiont of Litomosoides brasiliensis]|nr:hypothetical protein [Wolbachia endosymbiont of Litomosoides brasiliensis]
MGYGVRWWCLIGIATVSECYCAMDRDNKWERTIEAYETIALGQDVIEM